MRRPSRQRLGLVLLLIASLLFQQVAVAALACPGPQPAEPVLSAHCAAMGMAPAPKPNPLCEQHCSPTQTVPTDATAGSVPALAMDAMAFTAPLQLATPALAHRLERELARPSPPPRLRYCRLLI